MLEAAEARGQPLPSWAQDPPALAPGEDWYLRAFWALGTERQLGYGSLGPIPWSRIVAYGERSGLSPGMVDVVVEVVQAMDGAYLKWRQDESEAEQRRVKAREEEE